MCVGGSPTHLEGVLRREEVKLRGAGVELGVEVSVGGEFGAQDGTDVGLGEQNTASVPASRLAHNELDSRHPAPPVPQLAAASPRPSPPPPATPPTAGEGRGGEGRGGEGRGGEGRGGEGRGGGGRGGEGRGGEGRGGEGRGGEGYTCVRLLSTVGLGQTHQDQGDVSQLVGHIV